MAFDPHPYSDHKPLGLPWLAEIPSGWQILRGKNVFQVIDVRSETGDEELLTVSASDGVVPRSQKTVTMFKAESYVGHKLCWPGDLVINSLWAWMQGLGFSRYHGLVSSAYSVYRPRPAFTSYWRYFDYLLRSASYKWELQTRSKGVWLSRLQLSDPAFLDMPILIPPPDEQAAIVRFLDHANRRIRRYIAAKRRLIALLNEQKQAIIQHAVTRGLDPNVPLKPSSVSWLGDVPANWEVVRIKYLLREVDARSVTGEETLLSLRMSHGLVPHDEHFARPGQASSLVGYKLVRPGQVVLNRLQANNGLVFSSDVTGVVSPDYAVFDPIADIDIRYLTTLFRTPILKHKFRIEAKGLGTGTSGFLRLYTDRFGTIQVPLPPRGEQTRIMEELDRALSGLQKNIAGLERGIDLVREYRTRLIADVVTGKLDVRAAAASLSDEPDVAEPLEDTEDEALDMEGDDSEALPEEIEA
ncbi:MAG: restriction endonuclease subunit S [Anaerolineae bacterium]